MQNKLIGNKINKVETTIGELVEAVTKIAAEHTSNEQEQYMLASQAMEELLNTKQQVNINL